MVTLNRSNQPIWMQLAIKKNNDLICSDKEKIAETMLCKTSSIGPLSLLKFQDCESTVKGEFIISNTYYTNSKNWLVIFVTNKISAVLASHIKEFLKPYIDSDNQSEDGT